MSESKQPDKQNTFNRFDKYVNLYNTYRLSYNNNVIDSVLKYTKIPKKATIADIGAGTGILTHQILKRNFKKIYAVEPNAQMQEYSIEQDTKNKITHLNEMSFNTSIPTSSVDMIVIGTAIHWFEPKKTIKEFKRILKKGGFVVNFTSGQVGGYGEDIYNLQQKYCNKVKHERYKKGFVNYSQNYHTFIGKEKIKLSEDQLIGYELSISTVPQKGDPTYVPFINGIKQIFHDYATKKKLMMVHKTTAIITNILL